MRERRERGERGDRGERRVKRFVALCLCVVYCVGSVCNVYLFQNGRKFTSTGTKKLGVEDERKSVCTMPTSLHRINWMPTVPEMVI